MTEGLFLTILPAFTLGVGLAWAVWHWRTTRKVRDEDVETGDIPEVYKTGDAK